jgi:hypothetical protein
MTRTLLVSFSVAIFGAAACGGSVAGGGSTGEPEGAANDDGAQNNGSTSGGDDGLGTSTGAASGSTGSGDNGGQCTAGSVDLNDPCQVCVVTKCTAEAKACCEQNGCLDIIACARETGCDGAGCYAPDTCQKQIDAAGGITVALEFAQPLGDCAIANCQADCGGS